MTAQSTTDLLTRANQIRTETGGFANTAARVGGLLRDMIDSQPVYSYKATGNSTDQALLQAAITAATTLGFTVYINGTVNLSSGGLTLPNGATVVMHQNAVLDISGAADATCALSATGSEGATLALTANAAKGATSISLSAPNAATLAQGDLIRVCSNSVFDASSTNSKIGELVRVASVSGTTVTLETPLRGGAYNTANSATASKVTPVRDIWVSGGKILGGGTVTTVGVDKDHRGVQIFLGERCVIDNVDVVWCSRNRNVVLFRTLE